MSAATLVNRGGDARGDFARPEAERPPEFHPQLARAIASIAQRLSASASAPAPPTVDELGALVAETRALLDEFRPSLPIAMTAASILLSALPLERVPVGTQLQWLLSLCAPHLCLVGSFRQAEAHINGARRFLEGEQTLSSANAATAMQPALWSRALACAMVPFWACRLSANSKHLGAQLAIVTRNLCAVIAECALGGGARGHEASGAEALCALVATNSLVAVVGNWTRALRRLARPTAGAGPSARADDAQWALAQTRLGWQGELLLSGVHVLLDLLPPGGAAAAAPTDGPLCHAAAVGLGLLLRGSAETLHQLEAMRLMRAHAGRPRDQYAPPGLEGSGACFSQRLLRATLECCSPVRAPRAPPDCPAPARLTRARAPPPALPPQGQPASLSDAGLVLLCALDGELWAALLAIVPADALRLARLLADARWPRAAAPSPPQPLGSFLAIGERLLYAFMEAVCALHRRACSEGGASSSQLLLLPLLTASELREEGFECAAVFYATVHSLSRDA